MKVILEVEAYGRHGYKSNSQDGISEADVIYGLRQLFEGKKVVTDNPECDIAIAIKSIRAL